MGDNMGRFNSLYKCFQIARIALASAAAFLVSAAAHSLPVTIDPGDYVGPYTVSQHTNLSGVQTVDLDPGSRFIVFPSTSSLSFDVDNSGNVSNFSRPGAAVANGSTITLQTVQVSVDPGAYTGPYRIFPSQTADASGVQTASVVRNFRDWAVVFKSTSNIRFDVDAAGTISNIRRAGAGTTDGSTIFLNTTQVTVDPGAYTGPYRIAPSQTVDVTGVQAATIVQDVRDWQIIFSSTNNIRFDADATGEITNIRRPGSGSTNGSTITLNTVDITVDPTTYTGLFRVFPAEPSFSSGIQTTTVVKDVNQWTVLTNGLPRFRFDVNANGDPTPITFPLTIDGTAHDFNLFQDLGNPIASAGLDQSVDEGVLVMLNGTGSTDPQNDSLTYEWSQLAGPGIILSDTQAAQPTFTAPTVSANETVTVQLVVSDGSSLSDPDTVDITIKNANNPPVADSGDDATIKAGATTALNGSGSFDPDGDAITYQWQQVGGPIITLSDAIAQNPSFSAPATAGTDLIFKLIVSDDLESSSPTSGSDSAEDDTVKVSVVANSPPVANAGQDQARGENTHVSMNGSASIDPDGDNLTYAWTQLSGPTVALSDNTIAAPTFTAPFVSSGGNQITFQLAVTDDDTIDPLTATDTITITLVNVNDPPSCDLAEANRPILWPPNHKLKSVSIVGVEDPETGTTGVTISIDGVRQDEPVVGTGDGDTAPDAIIQSNASGVDEALIRAERKGNADGRVYEIRFTASDGDEYCEGLINVGVPKNRKDTPIDGGPWHNSLDTQ